MGKLPRVEKEMEAKIMGKMENADGKTMVPPQTVDHKVKNEGT